jgi:hypothetical protein
MQTYQEDAFTESQGEAASGVSEKNPRRLTIVLPDAINSVDLLTDEQIMNFVDDVPACGATGCGQQYTCDISVFDPGD